jgi:DHA1 family bicyclomycin/chloramphenicol resistance-like MFS transporter
MKTSNRILILLLGTMTAIGPFSIDMYLPGLQAISKDLNTPIANVQLTLTSFFFGFSFGQLIYGPVIDRFGRKTPLLVGLVIYVLTSIGCALADNVWILMLLRFFQSLGACAGMVISRAIVRDAFSPHEGAKVFSQIILVMGVAPIIAPSIGSLILAYASWKVIFVTLATIGILTILGVQFYLTGTKEADTSVSLKPMDVLKEYFAVITVPRFYTYTIASGFAASVMFAYIGGSPFVFMGLFGLSEQQYGWIFASNAAGLILSSQINRYLLTKFESERIVLTVSYLYLPLGILLFLSIYLGLGLIPMLVLIFLLVSGFGFIVPNSSALSMAPFTRNAGSASALMGGLQMIFAVLATATVSILHDGTAMPMAIVMGASGFLTLLSLLALRPHRYKN